jgi:hypothetical protein
MSLETHRVQVEQAIKTLMDAQVPPVPVHFENVSFNQPDNFFVAAFILNGDSFRANLGTNYVVKHPGLIQVDVLAPENGGTKRANTLAETIGLWFQEKDILLSDQARVIYRTPSYTTLAANGGFYRRSVRVDFVRHERY